MELNNNDKDIIRHLGYPKVVNLSCGSFAIKKDYQNTGVNELLGKKLADIMGIICPKYFLVEVDNERYLLSEDLNQYGKFTPAQDLDEKYEDDFESYPLNKLYQDDTWYDEEAKKLLHGNSLYDIWSYLEQNYSSNISKELTQEIVKIYIFDCLFLNFDRSFSNWGFIELENKVYAVMFDNEYIFDQDSIGAYKLNMNVNFNNIEPLVYDDFKAFLAESSSEFISLFKYYFDLITPEFLKKLIEQIEKRDNIVFETKNEIIDIYTKHRAKLLNIYEEKVRKEDHHAR